MPESQSYTKEVILAIMAVLGGFGGWIVKNLSGKVSIAVFKEFEKRYDDNQDHNEKQLDRIESKVDKICKPNSERLL